MQQHTPGGVEAVVAVPCGLGEGVNTGLVIQDALVLELLVVTPTAVEEIQEVVDISSHFEGGLTSSHIEVELLGNIEVHTVQPRSHSTVALAVLATVSTQIRIIADEGLVGITVL